MSLTKNAAMAAPPTGPAPPTVELFDPPLCCPTGLCGPNQDQTLLDVNEMVRALAEQGIAVARYQLASHPQFFVNHPAVMRLVRRQQLAALPITLVGGRIIKSGGYPTLAEVLSALQGGPA